MRFGLRVLRDEHSKNEGMPERQDERSRRRAYSNKSPSGEKEGLVKPASCPVPCAEAGLVPQGKILLGEVADDAIPLKNL